MIKKKILFADTALRYGKSYEIFKKKKFNKFNLITKISGFKNINDVERQIKLFLNRTNTKRIYSVLFHNTKDLENKRGELYYSQLKNLKKKYKISKIGFSVNNFESLNKLIEKYRPEIIQTPFSILDRRILSKKYQKLIKKYNVEVHIRSIFLRGVLLNKNAKKINLSIRDKIKLKKLFKFYKKNQLDPQKTCLQFVLNYKFYKKIVIGIDNIDQLQDFINFQNFKFKSKFLYGSKSKSLIMPSEWKLKKKK